MGRISWIFFMLLTAALSALDAQEFEIKGEAKTMILLSPGFIQNGMIPKKFTCQGEDVNPVLSIEDVPQGTQSLVLIMDDPDAPMGTWDHWVVYDIPPVSRIEENSVPGKLGMNSWGKSEYGGPCPPFGIHRYFFKLYALDTKLNLEAKAVMVDKKVVENAMEGHILAKAELIGRYQKS